MKRKIKKKRKVKSIGFVLTMLILVVLVPTIIMSIIRCGTMPPRWITIILVIVICTIFISGFITQKRDITMPRRRYNIATYLKGHFITYLLCFWMIASFDILANIYEVPPVDYYRLPTIFLHTIGYIFVMMVVWLVCIQLFFKRYFKLIDEDNQIGKIKNFRRLVVYIYLFVIFSLMLVGMRILLTKTYGYYNTDYSRYGDIASLVCVFGGLYAVGLMLCIQNRSKFIPFKFLDSLVEKVLEFDKRERNDRLEKEKKKRL